MASEPLVSVATPVYNGADYLEECIVSVLAQEHENFEYAIVDNASTDETPEIAARFAARDSRVRHVRFEDFVSATENHNRAFRGIDPASEYCKIVQADDWIYPNCLLRMTAAAEISPTIGVVSAYRLWGTEVDLVGLPYEKTYVAGHEILRQCLLGGPYVTGAPTALLFRSRFVRERGTSFFERGYIHEDTEAAYWMLTRHDFGFVHQVLTFARRQKGARLEWADGVSTAFPENIRFLIKYGHEVFRPDEYDARLGEMLRKYIRYHMRQFPKPSRSLDAEFFAVHHAEIDKILEEGGDNREIRSAMRAVRLMLSRRMRNRDAARRAFDAHAFWSDPVTAAGESDGRVATPSPTPDDKVKQHDAA